MKKIKTDEIYTLKLSSGEEIIAKIVSDSEDDYEVVHPIMVVVSQHGLQLMPGLFTNNNDEFVTINKGSCVMLGITREDIKSKWIEATTGITTEPKQILTG